MIPAKDLHIKSLILPIILLLVLGSKIPSAYASTLIASYSAPSLVDTGIGTDNYNWYGECFKTPNDGNSYDISSADFQLRKDLSPSATTEYVLYASTGTCGTSATPTGSVLATSDSFSATTIAGTYGTLSANFSTSYTMSPNTDYFIMAKYDGTYSATAVYVGVDTTQLTDTGNRAYTVNNGSTYTGNNTGMVPFHVYGNVHSAGGSSSSSNDLTADQALNYRNQIIYASEFMALFLFSFWFILKMIW